MSRNKMNFRLTRRIGLVLAAFSPEIHHRSLHAQSNDILVLRIGHVKVKNDKKSGYQPPDAPPPPKLPPPPE
ncbi:MAG: hypothetical protein JXA62_07445, partial [Candidatus Aminicenantes bacterium]|nr:hypothetical protein [Candidatus Aminicenantes bacterium]